MIKIIFTAGKVAKNEGCSSCVRTYFIGDTFDNVWKKVESNFPGMYQKSDVYKEETDGAYNTNYFIKEK